MNSWEAAAVRRLVNTVRCPRCGKAFHADDVGVLDHRPDEWLLDVVCRTCESYGLVLAEIETDTAPIDALEVDEWRRFLRDFDGDLRDLLRA